MAYIDSIAYMLYSSGIKSDDLKILDYKVECALSGDVTDMLHYDGGARLSNGFYPCIQLNEHAAFVKELIDKSENNIKTYISEEE